MVCIVVIVLRARGRVRVMCLMRLPARVMVLVARVHEALVAHKQVAASERLGAYLADEGLLFGMGSDVSLEMFL